MRLSFFSVLYIVLLLPLSLLSCKWEIPKSIGIKTEAEYNFSIGEFSGDLQKYISVQTLTDMLGESASEFDFDIYDYYPKNSKLPAQQYLIDLPMHTTALDMADYLKNMDFSKAFENMNFEPDIIDLKDFKMDSITPISIPLDINNIIETQTSEMTCNIKIPKVNGEFKKEFLAIANSTITISSPTFDKMEFHKARIDFTAETIDDTSGFKTNLTLGLFNDGETEPISTIKNVNLPDKNFSFPLDGKSITKKLLVKVISGSATITSQATTLEFLNYNLKAQLKNVKIKEVKNLTLENKIEGIPIGNGGGTSIKLNTGSSPKCVIEKGAVEIIAEQPPAWNKWTGVTVEPKITLEGEINATDNDFIKDEREGDGYFIYRRKELQNVVYRSDEAIKINGTVDVDIKNADIMLKENEDNTIKVEPKCTIEKVSSLYLDLSNENFTKEFNQRQGLGKEITKYIYSFGIEEENSKSLFSLDVKYINTLPKGNDIKITVQSRYFDIESEKELKSGKAGDTVEKIESNRTLRECLTEKPGGGSEEIDFNVRWELQGLGEDPAYPNCVILKNLDMSEAYEIKINVAPTLNWDYVKIKPNGIQANGSLSSGLNMKSLFKQFEEKLGDEGKGIVEKIELIEMPLYLYCVMPFKGDIPLYGKINVGTGTIEGEKPVWDKNDKGEQNYIPLAGNEEGEEGALKTMNSLPRLYFNDTKNNAQSETENKTVIEIETVEGLEPKNVAPLFNSHKGNDIIFEYGMNLGNGNNEPIKLSRNMLDTSGNNGQENSTPANIQIHARIVLPMKIKLKEKIKLSLLRLLDKDDGKDLFNRNEATSIDIVDSIVNALEYAEINAYFPSGTGIIRYFNIYTQLVDTKTNIQVIMDTNIPGIKPYTIDVDRDNPVMITGEHFSEMLKVYPFAPDIYLAIPKGCFYIHHNLEYDIRMDLGAKFNGEEIPVFGDTK